MARILLVDEQPLYRLGVETALVQAGHQVVGIASNGLEGLDAVRATDPELVILDLDISRLGGLDFIKRVKARDDRIKLLVLTAMSDGVYEHLCVSTGASGFVLKTDTRETLIDAVNKVLKGRSFFKTNAVHSEATAGDQSLIEQLTPREVTVLHYLADGYRIKQIAGEMALSDRTVSTYKTRLLEKVGANSLVELLQIASQHGLLEHKDVEEDDGSSLSAVELQFTALMDKIPNPLCLRSPDSRIRAANQAYLDYLGLPKEQVINSILRDLGVLDDEHLDYCRKTFDSAVANKAPYMMVTTVYVRGQRRVVRHGGCPVLDSTGNLIGMLCSNVDLDEESQHIQSLNDQISFLKTLRKRRGVALQEQEREIHHEVELIRTLINETAAPSNREAIHLHLERIEDRVTLLGELVRLESEEGVIAPYPQDLDGLTQRILESFPKHAIPHFRYEATTGHPIGWLEADRYTTLLKAVLLHLHRAGFEDVTIHAQTFDPNPSTIEWTLEFNAQKKGATESTAPMIYLALASELCRHLNGRFSVIIDSDDEFVARVTLAMSMAAPSH